MQIRVLADTTPATEYNTTTLNNAFASTSTTEGAYAAAQRAPHRTSSSVHFSILQLDILRRLRHNI